MCAERNAMSPEEVRTFLLDGTRTAKLATTKQDGSPHVVPVWFVLDGDALVFTTWHLSLKAKNLSRDPRASVCVDDQAPPYSFVQVNGTVMFEYDLGELRTWATRIGAR